MLSVSFAPSFVKKYNSCENSLQEEIVEKIELLKNKFNHKQLKVHKLNGQLADRYSFSVNYKIRIVFRYIRTNEVALIAIGDHDLYK